jgi:hypothetical protein
LLSYLVTVGGLAAPTVRMALVILQHIAVDSTIVLPTERYAPTPGQIDLVAILFFAVTWMKPQSWQVHVAWRRRGV